MKRNIEIKLRNAHNKAKSDLSKIAGVTNIKIVTPGISYTATIKADDEPAIEEIIRKIETLWFVDKVVLDK